jgi:hypothetical protein
MVTTTMAYLSVPPHLMAAQRVIHVKHVHSALSADFDYQQAGSRNHT